MEPIPSFSTRRFEFSSTTFHQKALSVPLAILNPEPVINKSRLGFTAGQCGPMMSLY